MSNVCVFIAWAGKQLRQSTVVKCRRLSTLSILFVLLVCISTASAQHSSSSTNAVPMIGVDALFQYTTARNYRVITQAMDFVTSMQTAPTCTRLAALHLMNECKLLEHAPDFARSRPEAYLDSIKTEYAAKLAVCELLSAQPNEPQPPPNCEVLVPSANACVKGSTWWYSRPERKTSDQQCYPAFTELQYTRCLKSLQSSPQYWTSFSNARQNAVVMCQASRDAIERENHLETFKNLTEIINTVSKALGEYTEDYQAWNQEQKVFADDLRKAQDRLKEEIFSIQQKVLASIGTLDQNLHIFMERSMTELVRALSSRHNKEITRIGQSMKTFSHDIMAESLQLAAQYKVQLQAHHEHALSSFQRSHEVHMQNYDTLSVRLGGLHGIVVETVAVANSSLDSIAQIEHRLVDLAGHADQIAQGFAFLGALPRLLAVVGRGLFAALGAVFLFGTFYKFNKKLAAYIAGALSSAFFLQTCGLYEWVRSIQAQLSQTDNTLLAVAVEDLSMTQTITIAVLVLWLGAYPVSYVNACLGSLIGTGIKGLLASHWVCEYTNGSGIGLLPSVEIPTPVASSEIDARTGFTTFCDRVIKDT